MTAKSPTRPLLQVNTHIHLKLPCGLVSKCVLIKSERVPASRVA